MRANIIKITKLSLKGFLLEWARKLVGSRKIAAAG